MALIITKATDPIEVKQVTVVIYSAPGIGKTSTGYTADAPLLLDFDKGSHRSQFRKDSVQVRSWDEIDGITADDLKDYKTVVVDTAGRGLDALTAYLIAKNPKLKGYGGALSLQGYGALKSSFVGWLNMLHSFGKDVVLVAHADEQKNGDELIERLDVQGGSKAEIYKSADAMGRLYLTNGKRILNFSPTDTAFGKNPAQFSPIPVPDFHQEPNFLAEVISQIKEKLNEQSEASLAEQSRMADLKASFEELSSADEFTEKVKELAKAETKVKALFMSVATTKGYTFDKKTKQFVAAEVPAEQTAEAGAA